MSYNYDIANSLLTKINGYPRKNLAFLPTPLSKMDNFADKYGYKNIFIKRDDQTGLAFGGNKTRKLEFILADALDKKAKTIITWGGVQSNWCRQTIAAANLFSLKTKLILFQKPAFPKSCDGNLFLDFLLGADVRLVKKNSNQKTFHLQDIEEIIAEEAATEEAPYIVPVGGSLLEGSLNKPLGAISYVNCFLEIIHQCKELNISLDKIIIATGSGGTHAGLLVGAKAVAPQVKIIAHGVGDDKATMQHYAKTLAIDTIRELNLNIEITDDDVVVFDEFGGESPH